MSARLLGIHAGVWFAVMAVACGSEKASPTTANNAALLASCASAKECASGLCTVELYTVAEQGVCTSVCASDEDCGEAEDARCREVLLVPEGSTYEESRAEKVCVLPCTESEASLFECKDGERLFCRADSGASCKVCGCAAGSYCASDEGCVTLRHGGEECTVASECLSASCEKGRCTAGQGDPCSNCSGACRGAPGASYCMPECISGRCPTEMPYWECVRDADDLEQQLCARVCNESTDCLGTGDVCDPIGEAREAGLYFGGFCNDVP